MTIIAADDFNRSDRNLLSDTASDGGTWEQWESGDTTDIKIVSNQCTTGDNLTHYLIHSGVADDNDMTVTCTCDPTGDKARYGLVVHAGLSGTSQKTGYIAWRDTSVNRWQMYRVNGDGTSTRIYNSAVTTVGDAAPGTLEFDGTVGALVLSFAGSAVTSTVADSTYTAGKAGMAWGGGSGATSGQVPAYFDDWQAETPVAAGGTTVTVTAASFGFTAKPVVSNASTMLLLGAATFSWAAKTITALTGKTVTVGAATFSWAAQSLNVNAMARIIVNSATFAFTANALTAGSNKVIQIGAAAFNWTAGTVTAIRNASITIGAAAFQFTRRSFTVTGERITLIVRRMYYRYLGRR